MRKICALGIALSLVFIFSKPASAIDVKVDGVWQFNFGYYSHNTLHSAKDTGQHEDRLRFRQRTRTQVRFIADETLSALINFEIGDINWGQASSGGALDADGQIVKIKRMFLDWTLPHTGVKTRMGIQGITLPNAVAGSPVLDADVAGITVSTSFTPEIGLTFFYARPFDGGWDVEEDRSEFDEMDMFGITLPITTKVVKATPWGMFAFIGKDSGWYGSEGVGAVIGDSANHGGRGRSPINPDKLDGTGWAWWAGTTFELPIIDPFFVKLDAMMGGLESGDSDTDSFGYFIAADIGYKFSFGRLSAIGWYSSGDDDVDDRGTMPVVSDDGGFYLTSNGLAGGRFRGIDSSFSTTGIGMWGMGLQLADVSFIENLSHTVRAVYMRGTNSGSAVEGQGAGNKAPWNWGYFLSTDSAYEVNLLNTYHVTENLTLGLDFSYFALELGHQRTDKSSTKGSFATMLGIEYAF